MDPVVQVGQRARVNLREIPKAERQCEVGVVTNIQLRFPGSEMQEFRYTVRFDKPYIKPERVLFSNIKEIRVSEGSIAAIREVEVAK